MQKQLKAVTDSLRSAQSRLRRLDDKLSAEEWSKRPGKARWSAAECVEHLNLTSRAYLALARCGCRRTRAAVQKKHYGRSPRLVMTQ